MTMSRMMGRIEEDGRGGLGGLDMGVASMLLQVGYP